MEAVMAAPERPALQLVAERLKQLYVQHRRLRRPAYKMGSPRRWQSIWPKAARLCAELRCAPDKLIRTAFEMFLPYPHPNQILSRAVYDRITRQDEYRGEIDQLVYRLECDELASRLNVGLGLEEALLDNRPGLSILFRYAVAKTRGLHDIVSSLELAARAEMALKSDDYLRLIPDGGLPEGTR